MKCKVGVMLSWFSGAEDSRVLAPGKSGAGERSARRLLASLLDQKPSFSTSN